MKLLILFCVLASTVFAESKAEAALRLQLEAAQRATAVERDARVKMEAALAEAVKERTALKGAVLKNATHAEVAAGAALAANTAAQQKDATDSIIGGQQEQSAKTDEVLDAVSAKYRFYQTAAQQIKEVCTFLGILATLIFSFLNQRALARNTAITQSSADITQSTHVLVNGRFGKQLSMTAVARRALADQTKLPADIAQAETAEAACREHDARQQAADALTP